ncbi:MAG TPA: response regulator [Candidatus Acidoferrum sp.]|nr:response regulator [Candidatus Acidoferrum sp.]
MSTMVVDGTRRRETTRPLRLLFLENEPQDAELALLELKTSGMLVDSTIARDKEQFLSALRDGKYDAVIADYRLPSWNGLEALKELRASGKDIPFLLVTGTLGEEAAVECIKQGADDFVLKDHLVRLPTALKRALQEKCLREENSRTHLELAGSEARAREQFAELEQIYRTAPIGLAVYGPDLRYLRVNEQLARINGMAADKHPGLMTRDVNPDAAKAIEDYLRRVFAKGESILNVEIQSSPDADSGARRTWLTSFHPLRGSSGMIFAISVVVQEITERKRAEEALIVSEARNRELVENSAYGICRVSADGHFLDPNPALLRILGCSTAKELAPPALVRDIFRYPAQYAECMATCRKEDQVHSAEMEWRRKDGGTVMVRLHARGLSVAELTACAEIVAEDVTEVRAVERQLQHSQKFEAIGQLAGGVAHDFNNVVGAILGWAELGFEQSRSYPQISERFSRIREQAERAATLTRELLAFARRQVLQPRTMDLNAVTGALASFLEKVIRKDIELKVVNTPLDPIKADPTQIEQVLMNLCLNARDAMPQGGRLLIETEMVEIDDSYCRFYPQVNAGRYSVLSVSDSGVGMDADVREHIFEPFFTTKEKGKNSGMGLATAYGIVKQHGGFIHVYSELGQGTLFRVYLPAAQPPSRSSRALEGRAISAADIRGSETLLLAEDHDSIREMARQALVNLGYRVLSAVDGEEALRLCESETPALAILDLVMPKQGGVETAAKLAERFEELPVLFTSGYSREARRLDPEAHYLQKPYSPTNLGRMVREILDEKRRNTLTS